MTLVWHWPQILMMGTYAFLLFFNGVLHGKEKRPDKYDFFECAFFLAVQVVILYFGGFFAGASP